MKNKRNVYILICIAILISGYFVFHKRAVPAKTEAQLSSAVEIKNGGTYDLSASYVTKSIGGNIHTMLAYNGSIPGPTIRVAQGSEVNINFKNNTDLPSLLHAHGVRMDNAFDGSQLQQKEITPGESFVYKLKFPGAGIYWYHPHAKEVYGQGLGLYGAFIVTPTNQSYFSPVNREMPLFLSDIPIENKTIALDKNTANHSLMGHYGNIMLVNGEEKYNLRIKSGEVVRMYIVNSANTRTFNLSIPEAKIKLVGADNGKYERETWSESVILSPSERAIVEVYFPDIGSYTLQHKTPERIYQLGTITAVNEKVENNFEKEFLTLRSNKDTEAEINVFKPYFNKPADKRLRLTIDMNMEEQRMMRQTQSGGHNTHNDDGRAVPEDRMMSINNPIEWEDTDNIANAMSNPKMVKWIIQDENTGKKNMDIDWLFKRGDPVKVSIFNDSKSAHSMQHPIHFHGQRFVVIARDGVKQTNLAWKDTALVSSGETVDIILDLSNPGEWMAHCHISEHLEAGMMMKFKVE